jgi:hypothetical protein
MHAKLQTTAPLSRRLAGTVVCSAANDAKRDSRPYSLKAKQRRWVCVGFCALGPRQSVEISWVADVKWRFRSKHRHECITVVYKMTVHHRSRGAAWLWVTCTRDLASRLFRQLPSVPRSCACEAAQLPRAMLAVKPRQYIDIRSHRMRPPTPLCGHCTHHVLVLASSRRLQLLGFW